MYAAKSISPEQWNCPKEYGVIFTPYGTLAPGAIIGAIAASLQHQTILLTQLFNITGIVYASSCNKILRG